MTSGQFHAIEVASIVVNRPERQRREISGIEILSDSIRRLGLIHPLVITRDNTLVSGERRLNAIRTLGWTHVSCQYVDEVDPTVLRAIELEENVKRLDIPWQDQCRAVREYHTICKRQDESWDQTRTSEALGLSKATLTEMLQVGAEIEKGNPRVLDIIQQGRDYSVARNFVRRQKAREDDQEIAKVQATIVGPQSEPEAPESILIEDFNEWVKTHERPLFNFIHCDFPYGIDADKFNQGGAPAYGGYADDQATWQQLMDSLERATIQHTTESVHLMFWFAMRRGDHRLYESTVEALEAMGWDINPLPLIWMKSDGVGIIPDPERGPRQIYETCLFGSKGDRKIVRAVANGYAAPTDRTIHMSTKPEPVLSHFFQMFVDENTVMLDPTCGSGSALRAAERLGAKFVLGLERDEEFADLARRSLRSARALRRASKGDAA